MRQERRAVMQIVGIEHHMRGPMIDVGEGNYGQVKRFLEETHPNFITLEVRLSSVDISQFRYIFRAPLDALTDIESEIISRHDYAGEYSAAVIYCRRNSIPLYFIDFYDIPPDRLANLNLTTIPNPMTVCTPDTVQTPTYVMDNMFKLAERNKFMAQAIDAIAQKYPGQMGVHIGGSSHMVRRRNSMPLQDLIHTPVNGITRLRLSPRR